MVSLLGISNHTSVEVTVGTTVVTFESCCKIAGRHCEFFAKSAFGSVLANTHLSVMDFSKMRRLDDVCALEHASKARLRVFQSV